MMLAWAALFRSQQQLADALTEFCGASGTEVLDQPVEPVPAEPLDPWWPSEGHEAVPAAVEACR